MNLSPAPGKLYVSGEVEDFYRRAKNYVEVFASPSPRQEKEITGHGHYGALVDDEGNFLAYDRRLGLHAQVANNLLKRPTGWIGLLVYKCGPRAYELCVTDFTRRSRWHHDPGLKGFLEGVPFFRGKSVTDVSYYDEAIEGPWHRLPPLAVDGSAVDAYRPDRENLVELRGPTP